MNKELEEAISRLNKFKTIKVLYGNTFTMHIEQLEQLQNDLKTVLKALDNSISKEVIEKKLNEIEGMIDKTTKGQIQKYAVPELILHRTIYNELLEGK